MANDIQDYIRQRAIFYGIDPNVALKVAGGEGGFTDPFQRSRLPAPKSQASGLGSTENSIGPFQLYVSGTGAGMGDKAIAAGIDPAKDWKGGVDFALQQAKQGGWGPWYGAKAAGITGFEGIRRGTGLTGTPSTNVDTSPGITPGTVQPPLNGTLTVGDAPVTDVATAPEAPATDTQGPGLLAQIADNPAKGLAALGKNKDFAGLLKGLASGGGGDAPQSDPIIQTGAIQSMEAGDTSRMANAQQMFNALLARKNRNRVPGISMMG